VTPATDPAPVTAEADQTPQPVGAVSEAGPALTADPAPLATDASPAEGAAAADNGDSAPPQG
jgi:hypothetical protein